jgi:two-component system, NtrC family, sensor kinase
MMHVENNRRILIIDDNPAIHEDFRKVLVHTESDGNELDWIKSDILGEDVSTGSDDGFELDSAFQGQEGLRKVQEAIDEGLPYAMAFVDIRMPPGWDGVATIEHLWNADPNLEVVICSAHSDYGWEDLSERLGESSRFLVLKKPFDAVEVTQIAHALTRKWALQRAARLKADELARLVASRTQELKSANRRLAEEMEERQRVEAELRLAAKLEAVGQLAAGIAHEINTPMQFIGDNVYFLREGFDDVMTLVDKLYAVRDAAGARGVETALLDAVQEAEDIADLSYLRDRVPRSFERTLDGVSRVSSIVTAMKAFSHPSNEKLPVDINAAIQTTLTVARNEYKYVADVETELGELPSVTCHGGDMNQVFLNLIVNAAHAIESARTDSNSKGHIRVQTRREGEMAVVEVSDTGCGIPEEFRDRVFDPFFTTKEVGRGTGQGLSLAHTIVVDKHGGSLGFESQVGSGTTFLLRIPIDGHSPPGGEVRP